MRYSNFQDFKRVKKLEESYKVASSIQEGFALTGVSACGVPEKKEYEGHLSVADVLGKIDAMTRMFENNIRDKESSEEAGKIIDVIENLYDLAQLKLNEAKRQACDYMKKTAGVEEIPEPSMEMEPESEFSSEEPEMNSDIEISNEAKYRKKIHVK